MILKFFKKMSDYVKIKILFRIMKNCLAKTGRNQIDFGR